MTSLYLNVASCHSFTNLATPLHSQFNAYFLNVHPLSHTFSCSQSLLCVSPLRSFLPSLPLALKTPPETVPEVGGDARGGSGTLSFPPNRSSNNGLKKNTPLTAPMAAPTNTSNPRSLRAMAARETCENPREVAG